MDRLLALIHNECQPLFGSRSWAFKGDASLWANFFLAGSKGLVPLSPGYRLGYRLGKAEPAIRGAGTLPRGCYRPLIAA